MEQSEIITGPWRATRLWNDVIRTFHSGMPAKKHRRNLRTYDNCFTGSEAVEWLHKHLKRNPNFGSDVSKEQAAQLLSKMLRARVMEPVDTPLNGENEDFVASDLYRLVQSAVDLLHTPGKSNIKSPMKTGAEKRRPFVSLLNTPSKSTKQLLKQADKDGGWGTRSEMSGLKRRKSYRQKQQQLQSTKSVSEMETEGEEQEQNGKENEDKFREDLNRSYFRSLPPSSLIVLDNDNTWKNAFLNQLRTNLSHAHVNSLNINVSYIIYNMTKVSSRGIVQLTSDRDSLDLPHWVLSAMKCLANWPRPMKMINGQESTLPNYPSFIIDVFNVVRDYFVGLRTPLVPYDLFDMFISANIKAEAMSAGSNFNKFLPHPSLDARRTVSGNLFQTSTPTIAQHSVAPIRKYHSSSSSGFQSSSPNSVVGMKIGNHKNYCEVKSPISSFETTASLGSSSGYTDRLNVSSSTAILRSVLPPNSCFETAFMNGDPVTRIVPQKEADTLHLRRFRSLSRASCYTPIPSDLDTRSIATQTSQEEQVLRVETLTKRQPRWKRSSRQRKSIAVMESDSNKNNANEVEDRMSVNSERNHVNNHNVSAGAFSSLDNLLDNDKFLQKYQKVETRPMPNRDDTVIFSSSVRKEKNKHKIKKERAVSVDRYQCSNSNYSECYGNQKRHRVFYSTSSYNNLTVKTPIFPPPGMQCVRAEPYQIEEQSLNEEGVKSAIDSFKLLALLLPPSNRRRLQLLLKFMRRVSNNAQLTLIRGGTKTNLSVVLDTFVSSILRPQGISSYDEELCRKIVKFFIRNYDSIWMPPESLRREVEEKVYQSLVSRRIRAGEDPFPITFCKQITTSEYNQEKAPAVHNAMRDLLEQTLASTKLSEREKKRKLKKFREAYPDIYRSRFPTADQEPAFMTRNNNLSAIEKITSLSKLRNAMRI